MTPLAPIDVTPFDFNPSEVSLASQLISLAPQPSRSGTQPMPTPQTHPSLVPSTSMPISSLPGSASLVNPSASLPPRPTISVSHSVPLKSGDDARLPTRLSRPTLSRPVSSTSYRAPPEPETDRTAHLVARLLPAFPTSAQSLQYIIQLDLIVLKRADPVEMPAEVLKEKSTSILSISALRPSTSGSLSGFGAFGSKSRTPSPTPASNWTIHQLLLTLLKINEPSPQTSPDLNVFLGDAPVPKSLIDTTQTIAYLHLYAATPPSPSTKKASQRPSTSGGMSMSVSKKRPGTAQSLISEAEDRIEVERCKIGPNTAAVIWRGDASEQERRFTVMKVTFFSGTSYERVWLCDMRTT